MTLAAMLKTIVRSVNKKASYYNDPMDTAVVTGKQCIGSDKQLELR